jgi:CspA family cold shock protein
MAERLMAELMAERLMAERVMATGTVKWFSDEKGYGFISADEGDDDLLVTSTSIADGGFKTLTEGARVEFEVHEGRTGLEAFGVVLVDALPGAAAEKKQGGRRITPCFL